MRQRLTILAGLALCLGTTPAWAIDLTTRGGFLFDISEQYDGSIGNGTIDAYDTCYGLEVNGTTYTASGGGVVDGRRVTMATAAIGQLSVTRTAFVPDEEGRDYVRYVDLIENTGTSPTTVVARYHGNLGSDSGTLVWGSSTGDDEVDARDTWYGTDDEDGSGDPSLAHAFWSASGRVRPSSASISRDNIETSFSVEVRPGETIALMVFAFQGPSRAAVQSQVEALLSNPSAAVSDLPRNEAARIVNWSVRGGALMPRVGSDELAALAAQGTLLAPEASGLASRLFEPPAVYLATLALAVRSVRERMDEAIAIAEELGGHVSSQDEATLVVRVPAGRFREALDRVERLGDVLVRRVAVQEPSERLRDLRARIRSASELRERLQRLASRAANASEAIAIQREIERLTQAIELLEGELASLEDRVLFSTIAVSFQAPSMLEEQPVARERFGLPFPWLDQLGLPRLLGLY